MHADARIGRRPAGVCAARVYARIASAVSQRNAFWAAILLLYKHALCHSHGAGSMSSWNPAVTHSPERLALGKALWAEAHQWHPKRARGDTVLVKH